MTKKDVDNLVLVLKYLNEIKNTNLEGIAKGTGLNITLVHNLLPVLITRKCIKEKQLTSSGIFDYSIDTLGKAYLIEETFQKEYEKEQREELELKLLKENIKNSKFMRWNIFFAAINTAILLINLFLLFKE